MSNPILVFKYRVLIDNVSNKTFYLNPTINDFELRDNKGSDPILFSSNDYAEKHDEKIKKAINPLNKQRGGIKSIRKTAKKNKNKQNKTLRKIERI